jgi:hypothetical protein
MPPKRESLAEREQRYEADWIVLKAAWNAGWITFSEMCLMMDQIRRADD